jgi:hypothetical protein
VVVVVVDVLVGSGLMSVRQALGAYFLSRSYSCTRVTDWCLQASLGFVNLHLLVYILYIIYRGVTWCRNDVDHSYVSC